MGCGDGSACGRGVGVRLLCLASGLFWKLAGVCLQGNMVSLGLLKHMREAGTSAGYDHRGGNCGISPRSKTQKA